MYMRKCDAGDTGATCILGGPGIWSQVAVPLRPNTEAEHDGLLEASSFPVSHEGTQKVEMAIFELPGSKRHTCGSDYVQFKRLYPLVKR